MTLNDIIDQLDKFSGDDTIYARRPWTPDSEAIVVTEPEDGGLPDKAVNINAEYFLEIFLVDEFLEGWLSNFDQRPLLRELCIRLIQYAENDA